MISLTDDADFGMFDIGSAEPQPQMVRIMERIAAILKERGAARSRSAATPTPARFARPTYDNWRLSTDRAQMAYYMLVRGGLEREARRGDRGLRRPKAENAGRSGGRPEPPHRNSAARGFPVNAACRLVGALFWLPARALQPRGGGAGRARQAGAHAAAAAGPDRARHARIGERAAHSDRHDRRPASRRRIPRHGATSTMSMPRFSMC